MTMRNYWVGVVRVPKADCALIATAMGRSFAADSGSH
jgi:hypothetical protein